MTKRHRQRKRRPQPSRPSPPPQQLDKAADIIEYHSDGSQPADRQPTSKRPKSAPRAPAAHPESDSSEDGHESEDDSHSALELHEKLGEESDVEVDIQFFDPAESDRASVTSFLQTVSGDVGGGGEEGKGVRVDGYGLATVICDQTRVGTVVRVGDEPAPIGFITCLNMRRHAKVVGSVAQFLLSKAGKKGKGERVGKFAEVLKGCVEGEGKYDSQRMGLVLCERVLNMPPMVVCKMYEALVSELEWALEDEPTEEMRMSYRFGWYLYIGEILTGGEGGEERMYRKAEDEVWMEKGAHVVEWEVGGAGDGWRRKRVAVLVQGAKLGKIKRGIESALGVGSADGGSVVDGEEKAEGAKR